MSTEWRKMVVPASILAKAQFHNGHVMDLETTLGGISTEFFKVFPNWASSRNWEALVLADSVGEDWRGTELPRIQTPILNWSQGKIAGVGWAMLFGTFKDSFFNPGDDISCQIFVFAFNLPGEKDYFIQALPTGSELFYPHPFHDQSFVQIESKETIYSSQETDCWPLPVLYPELFRPVGMINRALTAEVGYDVFDLCHSAQPVRGVAVRICKHYEAVREEAVKVALAAIRRQE